MPSTCLIDLPAGDGDCEDEQYFGAVPGLLLINWRNFRPTTMSQNNSQLRFSSTLADFNTRLI